MSLQLLDESISIAVTHMTLNLSMYFGLSVTFLSVIISCGSR